MSIAQPSPHVPSSVSTTRTTSSSAPLPAWARGEWLMAESNRQIIRKKRAQEDPALREILDRKLTAAEIEGIEIVKSAPTEEVKRATQVIQQGFLDHPDAEIRRGAAEILKAAEIPKNSPLIDQIASRVRPGTPPATQPLTAIGARNVGHQDTAPGQAVPGVDRVVVHRHEGLPEGRTAYWHGHDHDDTVNSNQGEAGIVNYDNRRHLNDPRHTRARGVGLFGVWEAKSAGSSVTDATKAISADSLRVQKLGDDLHDLHVDRLVRDRIESNTAAIQTLSMIAELAELRKGSRETTNKAAAIDPRVRRLVDEQQELRAIHANTGGVTTKTAP